MADFFQKKLSFQLRLDFSNFIITGPSTVTTSVTKRVKNSGTIGDTGTIPATAFTRCLTDTFSVSNPDGTSPPQICGINTGEHSENAKAAFSTLRLLAKCVGSHDQQSTSFFSVRGVVRQLQQAQLQLWTDWPGSFRGHPVLVHQSMHGDALFWQFQFQNFFCTLGDPIQLRLPKPRSTRLRPVLLWAKLRHRKEFQLQQQERPPPRGPTTEYMYQVGIKNVCVWSAIA